MYEGREKIAFVSAQNRKNLKMKALVVSELNLIKLTAQNTAKTQNFNSSPAKLYFPM